MLLKLTVFIGQEESFQNLTKTNMMNIWCLQELETEPWVVKEEDWLL